MDGNSVSNLDQTKRTIRSLLVSSKQNGLSVAELSADYRLYEGRDIPFRSFGYNSMQTFLISIDDTIRIERDNNNKILVFPLVSKESEHIHKFVAEDKPSRKHKRGNSNMNRNTINNRNRTPQQNNCYRNSSNIPNINGQMPSLLGTYPPMQLTKLHKFIMDKQQHQFNSNMQALLQSQLQQQIFQNQAQHWLPPPQQKIPTNANIINNLAQNRIENVVKEKDMTDSSVAKLVDVSTVLQTPPPQQLTPSSASGSRLKQTLHLQARENQSGHNSKNPCKEDSIGSSSSFNSDIVSDLDANAVSDNEKLSSHNSLCDEYDQLSILSFEKHEEQNQHQQFECVGSGACYPRAQFPDNLTIGSLYLVIICELNFPSKFWLHFAAKHQDLYAMMNTLEKLYKRSQSNELRISSNQFYVGKICAVSFKNVWHRAQIIDAVRDDQVKVQFVDYGTVCYVNVSDVRALTKTMASIPIQSFEGSLTDIQPMNSKWTKASIKDFIGMISEQFIYAKIIDIDTDARRIMVKLINTNGDADICINDELVRKGHAKYY